MTDTPTDRKSVIARETVCVPKEALDVLLLAADWAEARLEVRENPLRLALINIRAALDASASAGDALTVGEAEALLDAVELKTVGVVVRNETMAEARARHDALLSARDKLRALVERSRT